MCVHRTSSRHSGFTLVELIVVVAIIALLVALLLPAFSVVQGRAKMADAQSQFNGLRAGLESYRGESALGGAFPPSSSDNAADREEIANPLAAGPTPAVRVTGAHLLVHALLGADLLGTPGFKDLDRNGAWSNDTHMGTAGAGGTYALTPEGEPKQARYGGAGYVSDKMRERVTTLKELQDRGEITSNVGRLTASLDQRLFVDPWNRPILYYRANPAARLMINGDAAPGIYRQEDNGLITGSEGGALTSDGIDFGASVHDHSTQVHSIHGAKAPPAIPPASRTVAQVLAEEDYEHSLAQFIVDRKVTARIEPVNKDSFLLISAGADAQYGTSDDVTNWTRDE